MAGGGRCPEPAASEVSRQEDTVKEQITGLSGRDGMGLHLGIAKAWFVYYKVKSGLRLFDSNMSFNLRLALSRTMRGILAFLPANLPIST